MKQIQKHPYSCKNGRHTNKKVLILFMVSTSLCMVQDVGCSSSLADQSQQPPPPPPRIVPRGLTSKQEQSQHHRDNERLQLPLPPRTSLLDNTSNEEKTDGLKPSLNERLRHVLGTDEVVPPPSHDKEKLPLADKEEEEEETILVDKDIFAAKQDSAMKTKEHPPPTRRPADLLPERPPPPPVLSLIPKQHQNEPKQQKDRILVQEQKQQLPRPPDLATIRREPPQPPKPKERELWHEQPGQEHEQPRPPHLARGEPPPKQMEIQHEQLEQKPEKPLPPQFLAHRETPPKQQYGIQLKQQEQPEQKHAKPLPHSPHLVRREPPPPPPRQEEMMKAQQQQQMRQQYQQHPQARQQQMPGSYAGAYPQRQAYQARPQLQQRKSTPPRWKAIWNRVEKGLDELANLEDMVADRAKRILHTSSATVTRTVARPLSTAAPKQQQQQPRLAKRPTTPSERQQQQQQVSGTKNWADIISSKKKVIQANGGAFHPQGLGNTTKKQALYPQTLSMADSGAGANTEEKRPLPFSTLGENITVTAQPETTVKRPVPEWRPSQYAVSQTGQEETFLGKSSLSSASRVYPDELDIDEESPRRLSKLLGAITSPLSLLKRRRSSNFVYTDVWDDMENADKAKVVGKKKKWGLFPKRASRSDAEKEELPSTKMHRHGVGHGNGGKSSSLTPPIKDLLERSGNGKKSCLLSASDKRSCRSIGRSRAVMDVIFLGFILVGVHEIIPYLSSVEFPRSVLDFTESTLPALKEAAPSILLDSWAPFAFVAAIETLLANSIYLVPKIQSLASSVGGTVSDLTQYSQLYLRLVSSIPLQRQLPELCSLVASAQVAEMVESARLQSFVVLVLAVLFVATVSVVRPVIMAMVGALGQMVTLPQLREWPVQWNNLGEEMKSILKVLGETLRSLLGTEAGSAMEHPKRLAFQMSLFAALLLVSRLPTLARRRKTFESATDRNEEEEEEEEEANLSWLASTTENLNNLGVSSASRLNLQAEAGTIEGILERWRMMLAHREVELKGPPFNYLLRLFGYTMSAGVILSTPVFLYFLLGLSNASWNAFNGWDSLVTDLLILLLFSWSHVRNALVRLLDASDARPATNEFLRTLSSTIQEVTHLQQSPHVDMQFAAMISPSKGIATSDLWAAHTARRAWAVRGANLACRSGEVLMLLGEDGAGRTRLLTTLAEAMISPPTKARTTTRVRGSIQVGGIDVSKWDRVQLKRRLGLVLNDVRTVTDVAELMSGLTLEEILEPVDSTRSVNEPHNPGAREKSAMSLALKITGLSASLLPRLPANLSTVVTANEDELRPSALRPRSCALSPSDWSKVVLAKVLAQAIYDNDNQAKTPNSVDNCLMGSVLILDEATVHMSEIEEARFIAVLRRTGAATILTSHRWSTGRLADRITVIKNGALVESGPHNDLIRAGPQQSAYAQRWYAMAAP